MCDVRVRFAPSPTGDPHVGNIRTALFNYLYARHTGGKFIIRIEDTDQVRLKEGSDQAIFDSLRWLGITWDEGPDIGGPYGPYRQSERLDLYKKHALELVEKGMAYYCFCSAERLENMRKLQEAAKKAPMYDRKCLGLTKEEVEEKIAAGEPYVIRLKVPRNGTTEFDDLIRGRVSFENSVIDDQVLIKSDGFPTYHMACVVDDHYMKISHVIRAEEWISSTPKHIILYEAFGWTPPKFAHAPMVLAPDRSKLSKRHGATGVKEFRELGYLPEALANFLAFLGWAPQDEREIFSLEELAKEFEIERVNKSGAIFDMNKLEWYNGYYIRHIETRDLAQRVLPFLEKAGMQVKFDDYLVNCVALVQERMKTLAEAPELLDFFYELPEYDPELLIPKKSDRETTKLALEKCYQVLKGLEDWSHDPMEEQLRQASTDLGIKSGQLLWPLRAAMTGKSASPGAFEVTLVLGKEEALKRLENAISKLA